MHLVIVSLHLVTLCRQVTSGDLHDAFSPFGSVDFVVVVVLLT